MHTVSMGGLMTLGGLFLLVGSSWTLGTIALWRTTWPDLRAYERGALTLLAGLGLTSLLLSLLTLAGQFGRLTAILAALTVAGLGLALRDVRRLRQSAASTAATRFQVGGIVVLAAAILGCLGAIAPVTDDDALAYVLPISQHIARSGMLTVWSDQARSMWPQSQQVLLAYLLSIGGNRLGALTAVEFLLALGAASALARRACENERHIVPALIIAFGAPVAAFQIASAKEDLLVVAATAAAVVCLIGSKRVIDVAAAGLFAGIAAGAKYPGVSVVAVAVVWPLVAQQSAPFRRAAIVASCAALTGGLWYGLNLWRYGNPIAPFLFGASGTPLDRETIRGFVDGYGAGRSVGAFFLAPIRIFSESNLFCGRANLFNPLVYAGLIGLGVPAVRRRHAPLFISALILYIIWFAGLQNARFLLPAVVLIAPAAADVTMPALARWKVLLPLAWGTAVVSLGVVAAVGVVRVVRYTREPAVFLERETQNYADIQWMNEHLDGRTARVASDHKVLAYLNPSWLILDPTYQIEIARSELDDPQRFLEACRRQGITHLFGRSDAFAALGPNLRTIYQNPSSRRGGVRFFREPPTESMAVFEIVDSSRKVQPKPHATD